MNRTHYRPLLVLAACLVVTLLAVLSPHVLRHFDAFRVRKVEVVGARYLEPEEALALSGITDSASVFDDFEPRADRLRDSRLIEDVRFERWLPHTVRIHITETRPVALVRAAQLKAVDAAGRLLPVELAGSVLDVPILIGKAQFESEDSVLASPAAELVSAVGRIRDLDPELLGDVSEFGVADGGGLLLVMDWPGQPEILLPKAPDSRTLKYVREVLEHIRTDAVANAEEGAASPRDRLERIDARYRDELFVSFHSR